MFVTLKIKFKNLKHLTKLKNLFFSDIKKLVNIWNKSIWDYFTIFHPIFLVLSFTSVIVPEISMHYHEKEENWIKEWKYSCKSAT